MGDKSNRSQPAGDFSGASQGARSNLSQFSNQGSSSEHEAGRRPHGPSSLPPPLNYPQIQPYPTQQQAQSSRLESFSMTSLGTALPDMAYQGYGNPPPQRYSTGQASPGLVYQLQNVPQFPSSPSMNPSSTVYNMPYQNQYQAMYSSNQPQSAQHLQSGLGGQFYLNQGFVGQPLQQASPYLMQPNQYSPQSQIYAGSPSQYSMRNNSSGDSRLPGPQLSSEYLGPASTSGTAGNSSSISSSPGQSSVVRGPPRKPRQSGHAIWIGNLPPQTELMSLVLHVCKEASGLESLFLISKSNCAFANFKDEPTCAAAQQKIHDSKFQTVRLVSRLRRSSVGTASGVAAPTGPAALTPQAMPSLARPTSPEIDAKPHETVESATTFEAQDGEDAPLSKDRFFVVKSLTVEDLELSVRNGIWATQSHNEEALNKAYRAADNVYLIFSANKSGEYFGYARMVSPINDDPAAAIEFAPKAQVVEDPELPKSIPTPASEFAPRGRIIDDSARGTIFWEAEREDNTEEEDESRSNKSDQDEDTAPPSKAWGKPFKVEWLSTTRLPFYRTRGLRNPWNSNREVKIARDGTELETAIGRKLLALFHRAPEPLTQSLPQTHGVSLPLMGYPPMRPYQ